ncbi:hypothetical protein PSQ19_06310 [Devosia algicola]|uniref:AsmA-like C-terminal domain-containing protein n=1 Tax=Devosia algicola TaxID=3026418 RepID=A0ABY7YQZ5_9HYPH|nr:hypothetical protein [Devosia algicola]WDR03676.1 hypothetical protein PSQ19_06310 [Devosia algicola]
MIALGLNDLDLGFAFDTAWNREDQTIALNELSLTGANLVDVKLSGSLGKVSERVFSLKPAEALIAGTAIVVKNLNLNVLDSGLTDLVLTSVAKEQGTDAATIRPVFASLAQGTIVSFLVGAAEAQNVGKAVSKFIAGTAKSLSINLTAKEEPGLTLDDFMTAEDDPTQLIGKVNISASAE